MKSKQLTIIFFSVLMLTATPRVMSRFNSYSDALHHEVEAKWLDFLLGFATPAETDRNPRTEQSLNRSLCAEGQKDDVALSIAPQVIERKASLRSTRSEKRSIELSFAKNTHRSRSFSKEAGLDTSPVFPTVANTGVLLPPPPSQLIDVNKFELRKAAFLWRLKQSSLNGKNKATQALIRQLSTMVAEGSDFERIADQGPSEGQESVDKTMELGRQSEESMH